jgi:hypothetical protein
MMDAFMDSIVPTISSIDADASVTLALCSAICPSSDSMFLDICRTAAVDAMMLSV